MKHSTVGVGLTAHSYLVTFGTLEAHGTLQDRLKVNDQRDPDAKRGDGYS